MNAQFGRFLRLLAALVALPAAAVHAAEGGALSNGMAHMGVGSCAQSTCHGSVTPWLTSPVAQNEYFAWRDHDPHSASYKALVSEKGRGIAAKMGLKEATSAPLCLGCHTDNVPEAMRGAHFKIEDGIGCETCHGGAQKWIGMHNLPDADDESRFANGMYASAPAANRAQLCSGCHEMGQHGSNHRLMIAGHPRFPEDLAGYLAKWPKHYSVNDSYLRRKHPPSADALAAAFSLRQATDWAEALTHAESQSHSLMPEFSFFQCETCHRTTQQADPAATGMPRLNDVAIRRVIRVGVIPDAARRAEIEKRLNALEAAVLRGNREEYSVSANSLYQSLKAASAVTAGP